MSDQSSKFANDIKAIGDTITVQIFSQFYHFFFSAHNRYIEEYHDFMNILKRNGGRADDLVLDELFHVAGMAPIAEIKSFLNSALIRLPAAMLEEDELLPLEEDLFRDRYPQFRALFLRENFSARDVHEFQARLYEFSRLITPTLSEMERISRDEELILSRKYTASSVSAYIADGTGGIFSGFPFGKKGSQKPEKTDKVNDELFDLVFRYCVCWQNLIDTLKNHARELYQIYHGFFMQGLFNKYRRFYGDVKATEPEKADTFFAEFMKMEIQAFDNEFDRKADPEDLEDSQTIRDVCRRVENFFEAGSDGKFY